MTLSFRCPAMSFNTLNDTWV